MNKFQVKTACKKTFFTHFVQSVLDLLIVLPMSYNYLRKFSCPSVLCMLIMSIGLNMLVESRWCILSTCLVPKKVHFCVGFNQLSWIHSISRLVGRLCMNCLSSVFMITIKSHWHNCHNNTWGEFKQCLPESLHWLLVFQHSDLR